MTIQKKREKKYQISSQILLCADGWVKAKNIKEAKKQWKTFCLRETNGISSMGVEINEVITPKSKYYDKNNIPPDKDFEDYNENCITYNYLN